MAWHQIILDNVLPYLAAMTAEMKRGYGVTLLIGTDGNDVGISDNSVR